MVEYCEAHFKVVEHLVYPDHYDYKMADIRRLKDLARRNPEACFLTTEKDMVKLNAIEFLSHVHELPMFYLPITVRFLRGDDDFGQLILEHVSRLS